MNSTLRNLLFWAVLILAVVFLVRMLNTSMGPAEQEPTFSEFMDKVEAGEVATVEIRGNLVEGAYKDNAKFKTYIPPEYPEIYKTLREKGVQIKVKDAGSIDAAYVKRDMQPIQEGHALLLTESNGTSANPGGLVDGFSVSVREIGDLRQGNGPQQGYTIFIKGPDQEVVRFEGMVTTTMKDGKPNTTMKGTYAIVGGTGKLAGIEGGGTYTGYFTAEDKFRIDWEGTRSAGPRTN